MQDDLALRTRVCLSCRKLFIIPPDEAEQIEKLRAEQGDTWQLPKRCRPCRKLKRDAKPELRHY